MGEKKEIILVTASWNTFEGNEQVIIIAHFHWALDTLDIL